MKSPLCFHLSVTLLLLLAGPAMAAEEITGRDGRSAMVEVLETAKDSISVEYRHGETTVKAKIPAKQLEPYSFYEVRKRHMEDTAENHLALARFCYENKLLGLAKKHIDLAIATDPEFVEKRRAEVPDLVEKFSTALLADAAGYAEKGDMDDAELALSILFEAFPDTKAAADGHVLLGSLDEMRLKQQEEARAAKVEKVSDEAAKKAAKERQATLDSVANSLRIGQKTVNEGLKSENQSKAKGLFEQATAQFKATLGLADSLAKDNAGNAELLKDIEELRATAVHDCIRAYCLAGGISLSRGALTEADDYARKALALDVDSSDAQGFNVRVQNAISTRDDIDGRSRGPRGGGRR